MYTPLMSSMHNIEWGTKSVACCSPCKRRTSWWCRQRGCRGRWGTLPPPSQSWRSTWRWSPQYQRRRSSLRRSFAAPLISLPSADLQCTYGEWSTDEVRGGVMEANLSYWSLWYRNIRYLGNMLERSLSARVFSAVSWLVLSSTTSSKWFAYFSNFSTILSSIFAQLHSTENHDHSLHWVSLVS